MPYFKIKYGKILLLSILISCLFSDYSLIAQRIIINEISSSNFQVIQDEDSDYSDWIELFNAGSVNVNLEGYQLSDDTTNTSRWVFPKKTIAPGEFLLVWASGKDRRPEEGEGQTGILRQVYKGITGTTIDNLINHSSYPKNPTSETLVKNYFEAPINIDDNYGQRMHGYILAPLTGDYTFWIASDDNSQLLLSSDENQGNVVKIAEVPDWTNSREWNKYPTQRSAAIFLEAGKLYYISALMKEGIGGDNLAVRWRLPDNTMEEPIPASRIFWQEAELHTNFSIKASGEPLILSDPEGNIIDFIPAVEITFDLSFGRLPDGSDEWVYFYEPTPGSENINKVFAGRCEKPLISPDESFSMGNINVSITSPTLNSEVYYTLDSSDPSRNSTLYTGPVQISKTTSIRARAFSDELQPSVIATKTYFLNENISFPVVSVTTDPYNLYDAEYGMFVYSNPYWESNLFQKWERPASIEFFEPGGQNGFSLNAGIRVHGGLTRHNPQKSLAIMARSGYGESHINYKIFEDKEIDRFNNIIIRNSGNDYNWTMFRDCMMHSLIKGRMDLELSSSRPSVVFLNGKYWGIRNIREKLNEHFIVANTSYLDTDKIDQLEYIHHNSEVQVNHGSADSFNELINYIKTHDLTIKDNYDYVASQIDINNYIQYNTAQIYFDNSDWPGNNIKWWRSNSPVSKWRWLLFDTDFGFGLSPFGNEKGDELLHYKHNTLLIATAENGDEWPNPPHSTFLLRNLLKHQDFKYSFINSFCDHLNTSFLPDRVINIIDSYQETYQEEIIRHHQTFPQSAANWLDDIEVLREFARNRTTYMHAHLMIKLNLQRVKTLTLNVSDTVMGKIRINTIQCPYYPWAGKYFPHVPVKLFALPQPGYRFTGWSDGISTMEREVNVNDISQLTALFEASEFDPYSIVINEIKYMSTPESDSEDWVELYNNSDMVADISQWIFKDDVIDHQFLFPENTYIQPRDYLVLCRDTIAFRSVHGNIPLAGNMDFGFSSKGETLILYDSENKLIDYVRYDVVNPWPDLTYFTGSSIELIDPDSDNTLASNWKASKWENGTPHDLNSTLLISAFEPVSSEEIYLGQNYPNPFSLNTNISYTVSNPGMVTITIYDLSGKTIKKLVNHIHSPGSYNCSWNGTSDSGEILEGGIYLYQLRMKDSQLIRRMVFIP